MVIYDTSEDIWKIFKIYGYFVNFENFENFEKFWIFLKILEKTWKFWKKIENFGTKISKVGGKFGRREGYIWVKKSNDPDEEVVDVPQVLLEGVLGPHLLPVLHQGGAVK